MSNAGDATHWSATLVRACWRARLRRRANLTDYSASELKQLIDAFEASRENHARAINNDPDTLRDYGLLLRLQAAAVQREGAAQSEHGVPS